jgi:hypothetical protein
MLPGGIRMREVDSVLKVSDHVFMNNEHTDSVIGDDMQPVLVTREAVCDCIRKRLSSVEKDGQ